MNELTYFSPVKLEQIVHAWNVIEAGIDEVLKHAYKDDSKEHILEQLVGGNMNLVLIYRDEIWVGFFTIRVYSSYFNGEIVKSMTPDHFYIKPEFQYINLWKEVEEFMEKYARVMECKIMKAYSTRNADKRMTSIGYIKTYNEYVKEL